MKGRDEMEAVANVLQGVIKRAEENYVVNENDYLGDDGLMYCGSCNTQKQYRGTFGGEELVVPCMCECEAEKYRQEKAELARLEFELRVQRMREKAFPESNMQSWNFENDDGSNEQLTIAMKRYVENFTEFRAQGKGLLLWGAVGTGKTYAACEIANALISKGIPVLVTNFTRLLNTIQSSYEKQEYIDSLNLYDLLVIDDLGIERNTSYAQEQVYNVIDGRYRTGLPMIITTNLTLQNIKHPDNMENIRIYDRVLERCFPIEVNGDSHRKKSVRESYDAMKDKLGL